MPQQPQINFVVLNDILQAPIEKACGQRATAIAKEKFERVKEDFLEAFILHPVSQEIAAGEDLPTSDIVGSGNLFGFIGFEEGSHPIEDLYAYLKDNIEMADIGTYDRTSKIYNFYVQIPSKEDIKTQTPMPWGTARSWAFAIESGISGLNQYLFRQGYGRSGGGFEAKVQVRTATYQPQKYMSDLLNFLEKSLS